jgi:hypothetical protein
MRAGRAKSMWRLGGGAGWPRLAADVHEAASDSIILRTSSNASHSFSWPQRHWEGPRALQLLSLPIPAVFYPIGQPGFATRRSDYQKRPSYMQALTLRSIAASLRLALHALEPISSLIMGMIE